jgi:hypothetical protein
MNNLNDAAASIAYKQMSITPTRKVALGAITSSIVTVIVWMCNAYKLLPGGQQIPGEVAAALTAILSFLVSYTAPPGASDQIVPQVTPSTGDAVAWNGGRRRLTRNGLAQSRRSLHMLRP